MVYFFRAFSHFFHFNYLSVVLHQAQTLNFGANNTSLSVLYNETKTFQVEKKSPLYLNPFSKQGVQTIYECHMSNSTCDTKELTLNVPMLMQYFENLLTNLQCTVIGPS